MSQEQQKIQKYVIKSTPYGELSRVVSQLSVLSSFDPSSQTISKAFEDYSEDHLALIPLKDDYYLVMSSNKIQDSQYVDQLAKQIYTIDHLNSSIISAADYNPQLAEPVEELLKSLTAAAQKYINKYFKKPNGVQVFMDQGEDVLVVYLGLTAKNVQLGNYYSGEWTSKWKITTGSIEGTVFVKAHYFQSGNVQLLQKKSFKKDFQFKPDMNENATAIMKIIQNFECEIQAYLSELYQQMPNGFFKNLRRLAPVTKTKMAWNINAIKMNKNLKQSSK